MSAEDKTDNTTEKWAGKAKQGVGDATGDDSMKRQGENQESKADLKQAGEKVKDAFKK